MKLHRSICCFLSWSMYVDWTKQQQTGRQWNTIRWSWQWPTEALKLNVFLKILALLSNKKTAVPRFAWRSCTHALRPLHFLNLPGTKYPGICYVRRFVKSKMKPLFIIWLFHCHKSITFLYTSYYGITSLWQFSESKSEF